LALTKFADRKYNKPFYSQRLLHLQLVKKVLRHKLKHFCYIYLFFFLDILDIIILGYGSKNMLKNKILSKYFID